MYIFFILLLFSNSAYAVLSVSPPQLLISKNGILLTELRSTSAIDTTQWQVRIMEWTQYESQDHFTPYIGGIVTPRFFKLSPNEIQMLRIRIPSDTQAYFRIFIEQIIDTTKSQGINLKFKFSLPVYHHANEPITEEISFPQNNICITINNTSSYVKHISSLEAFDGLTHILPGSTATFCKKTPFSHETK
jgi:P pilus assembly chaperone PapD